MRLQAVLGHLSLGAVTRFENLAFVPVLGPSAIRNDLLLPEEALQTGYFTVTESGRVDTLLVENRLGMKVFVPAGATFEGNTQNRAAVLPVVVAPRSGPVPLLVRCAEEGQPLRRDGRMDRSDGVLLASARTGDVSQGEVWETISWTIRRGQLANPTNDYSAAVRRFELGDYLDAVGPPAEGQRGFIAAVRDGEHISFYADILGSQELYARLHERLWKSVAPEAKSAADRSAFVDIKRSAFVFVMAEASRMELGEQRLRRGFIGTICLAGGPPAVSALVDGGSPIQVSVRREPPGRRLASRPDHSIVFRRGDFPELGSGDS